MYWSPTPGAWHTARRNAGQTGAPHTGADTLCAGTNGHQRNKNVDASHYFAPVAQPAHKGRVPAADNQAIV